MKDEIDRDALKYALRQFHHRFPYHAVKCIKEKLILFWWIILNLTYYLRATCCRPWVQLQPITIILLSPGTKKCFSILADHCLADGYVGARISRAVLYFYFTKRYRLNTRIDFYHQDPRDIPPSVYQNMFENFTPENVKVPYDPIMPLETFDLSDQQQKSPALAFRFRISHDPCKQYAVSHGIGPGALFARLLTEPFPEFTLIQKTSDP